MRGCFLASLKHSVFAHWIVSQCCWPDAVTRNVSAALAPAAAPPEESPALADLGELIVSQASDNSTTADDAVPAPALKTSLPPGTSIASHLFHVAHLRVPSAAVMGKHSLYGIWVVASYQSRLLQGRGPVGCCQTHLNSCCA